MVDRLDLSGFVVINNAVFDFINQLLQEPVGAHIAEPGRGIVLATKNRNEQCKELVPHKELETAIPGAIALDQRNHEVEQYGHHKAYAQATCHVGTGMQHRRV